MNAEQLVATLLSNPSVRDKVLIERTYALNGDTVSAGGEPVRLGDDCAALPDGHSGYDLFAAEGIVPGFLQQSPWFAGYSAVMVNLSDVAAMGGRPTALTNVIWAKDAVESKPVWNGMLAACGAYNVPMVGGHTCYDSPMLHLAVSVTGKAKRLLTSFDAQPGEQLIMVIDMAGEFYENYPFWNASTTKPVAELRRNLNLLADVAEAGLSKAAKDISMGGIPGTLAMLTRTSGVGALLDVDAIPMPPGVAVEKWLTSFPSFGYLLTAKEADAGPLMTLFTRNGIHAAVIGHITEEPQLVVRHQHETAVFAQRETPSPALYHA